MSNVTRTGDPVAPTEATSSTAGLRRLYVVRFAFAIVWAGLLAATASSLTAVSVALLVLYPLFDVAAAAYDVRSSGATRPRGPLLLNMAVSLLAALALGVAVSSGIPDVLRVWGAWAIAAGVVQLVVAVQRRRVGGQTPLILSGGISTLAGASFVVMAAGSEPSLTSLAGYATLGGVFFLVSALRLGRRTDA